MLFFLKELYAMFYKIPEMDSVTSFMRERFFHESFAALFLAIVLFSRKTHENIAPDFLYDSFFVTGAVAMVNDYYFKLVKFEILKKF
jgi:hypothetical protein